MVVVWSAGLLDGTNVGLGGRLARVFRRGVDCDCLVDEVE